VAGHHSFFQAVRSWSLDCQRWWTRIWHGFKIAEFHSL